MPYAPMASALGHAASSNAAASHPEVAPLAQRHEASEVRLSEPQSANWMSTAAMRPAGLAGNVVGLFSAMTARTFVPGLR